MIKNLRAKIRNSLKTMLGKKHISGNALRRLIFFVVLKSLDTFVSDKNTHIFSKNFQMTLTALKTRLPILRILALYGHQPDCNQMLHCPFHPDRTPSCRRLPAFLLGRTS